MKYFLVVLTAITLATSIFAQGQSDRKEMTTHQRAAEELLIMSGADRNAQTMAKTISDAQLGNLPPGIPPAKVEKMRTAIEGWTQKVLGWKNMREPMIEMYVEAYTEKELNEIMAFYKTPTGAKSLELMPELTQKGAAISQALATARQAELIKAITEAMSP